jgi:hypothetical protein
VLINGLRASHDFNRDEEDVQSSQHRIIPILAALRIWDAPEVLNRRWSSPEFTAFKFNL